MHRTRPTPSMSQIHSLAPPVRSASWLRSGIRVSRSDSTSRVTWTGSPSSICSSPSTRTEGRDPDERYKVDAPRADDTRSSRSSPDNVGSDIGGGCWSDRTGLREIGSTTAGCNGGTARGCAGRGGAIDASAGCSITAGGASAVAMGNEATGAGGCRSATGWGGSGDGGRGSATGGGDGRTSATAYGSSDHGERRSATACTGAGDGGRRSAISCGGVDGGRTSTT